MISYKTIKQLNSTAKCLGATVRVKNVHSYVMLKKRPVLRDGSPLGGTAFG